jgi:hypothetical protein
MAIPIVTNAIAHPRSIRHWTVSHPKKRMCASRAKVRAANHPSVSPIPAMAIEQAIIAGGSADR